MKGSVVWVTTIFALSILSLGMLFLLSPRGRQAEASILDASLTTNKVVEVEIPANGRARAQISHKTISDETSFMPLEVVTPEEGDVIKTNRIMIEGRTRPHAMVKVNTTTALARTDGSFSEIVTLNEGKNIITVVASNESGAVAEREISVSYAKAAPKR